jgi:plastocyanin
MGKRHLARLAALVGAPLLTAMVMLGGQAAGGASVARAQSDTGPLITMSDNRYHSDYTIVNVGDTVTFRNDEVDDTKHDVAADDNSFGSPVIHPGESWSFTFAAEGYYSFYCTFHEDMQAAILVVAPGSGG